MNADSWRLHYTYLIAILVIVGAGLLVWMKLGEIPSEALLGLVTFALGLVLGFIFNRESSAGQARATERAIGQGAAGGQLQPEPGQPQQQQQPRPPSA